jgi:hypothetical protein
MRDYQLGLGIPKAQVYNQTMYILVGMLVIGLICNLLVTPVNRKHFMTDAELAAEKKLAHEKQTASSSGSSNETGLLRLVIMWAIVGIPLGWGVYKTYLSALKLFG